MSKQQNTIKLNGKVYDALTGELLSAGKEHKSESAPIKPSLHPKADKQAVPNMSKKEVPVLSCHREPHHVIRKPQHSKTLMRQAVKKPVLIDKSLRITDIHSSKLANHDIESDALDIMAAKQSRNQRAGQIPKSHLIHRFNSTTGQASGIVKKHVAHISVRPAPEESIIKEHESAPVLGTAPADIFGNAMVSATSHQQSLHTHNKRQRVAKKLGVSTRTLHIGMGVLAAVVLGGFVLYQNASNIRVQLAASGAGIRASMPGYTPPSFALDHNIQALPGEVILSFHSNTDGRNFKIVQTAAPADPQTIGLLTDIGQSYQPVNDSKGTTVYLSDNSSATWVKGSTRYTIEGNSNLSSVQLLKIANSF